MNTENIFNTVQTHDYLGFQHNDLTNYKSVVDFLEFDKSDVSKIANVSKSSVRYDKKIPKEVKEHFDKIANICQLVAEFFEGDAHKTALWFKIENPLLGNVSPRDMIRLGRYKRLMEFILDARPKVTKSGKK